jgi:hypothetical protein
MMMTSQPSTVGSLTPPEAAALTAQAPGAGPSKEQIQGITEMGLSIDRALIALSQAAPTGATQFSMARDLVKRGLAAFISEYGEAESPSPEEVGNQFPSSTVGQGY